MSVGNIFPEVKTSPTTGLGICKFWYVGQVYDRNKYPNSFRTELIWPGLLNLPFLRNEKKILGLFHSQT